MKENKNSKYEIPVVIYTDGACDPNPGQGAWAYYIPQTKEEGVGYEEQTTNQRMELTAIIEGIRHVKKVDPYVDITVFTDSQYCQKGFDFWVPGWRANGWITKSGTPVKNKELWQELDILRKNVDIKWVRGHDGDECNEYADKLARDCYAEYVGKPPREFHKNAR